VPKEPGVNINIDGLEGGCLCSGIRYRITGPSIFVSQCCCRDCQKATGTGHTTIVGIHKSQLSLTGQPKTYTNRGDSGGDVTRHFCGECGGRLYTSGTLPGDVIMIQAGSLDDPSRLQPQSVLYYKQAMPWDWFDPNLTKFDALPPLGV
jgi:hypothetical protein